MTSNTSALREADFRYVAELVGKRAAIVLETGKEYLVETRLRPLARSFECESIETLIDQAKKPNREDVRQSIVEALTTNETHFFRDDSFYEALREGAFPMLIENRRQERRLRMWCAATSSGQEPYSILMMLHEHFPELLSWKIEFVCSDISRAMLARTRAGVYTQHEVNRGLPITLLVKYFERKGLEWQIKKPLRDMLDVREVNLAEPWPAMQPLDIVFIRNVLIYFSADTKRDILQRIGRILRPDGFLFLGGSETVFGIETSFKRAEFEKASCYALDRRVTP